MKLPKIIVRVIMNADKMPVKQYRNIEDENDEWHNFKKTPETKKYKQPERCKDTRDCFEEETTD